MEEELEELCVRKQTNWSGVSPDSEGGTANDMNSMITVFQRCITDREFIYKLGTDGNAVKLNLKVDNLTPVIESS